MFLEQQTDSLSVAGITKEQAERVAAMGQRVAAMGQPLGAGGDDREEQGRDGNDGVEVLASQPTDGQNEASQLTGEQQELQRSLESAPLDSQHDADRKEIDELKANLKRTQNELQQRKRIPIKENNSKIPHSNYLLDM